MAKAAAKATTGTVTDIEGHTLYVTTSSGSLVAVKVSSSTTVDRNASTTLAGLKPVDRTARLRAGAHFLKVGAAATAANDEGFVTSSAFSPGLGHWIGLGLGRGGPSRIGERIRAYDPVRNGDVEVEVCSPVFVDPKGERLHG